jgi:hypothetical protein
MHLRPLSRQICPNFSLDSILQVNYRKIPYRNSFPNRVYYKEMEWHHVRPLIFESGLDRCGDGLWIISLACCPPCGKSFPPTGNQPAPACMALVSESCQPLWKSTRRKFDRLHSRLPSISMSFELGRFLHHISADNHGARRSIWGVHRCLGLLHLYLHPAGTASMLLQVGHCEELRGR